MSSARLTKYIPPDNRSTIMEDNFIRQYIGELLKSLRTQYLIDLIKPYTRLELSFLAKVSFCPRCVCDFQTNSSVATERAY
jgi:hypothetical protein